MNRIFVQIFIPMTIWAMPVAAQQIGLESTSPSTTKQLVEGASNESAAAKKGMTGLPVLAEEGYWIEGAPINEVFQYLARCASLQYFHNNELDTPEYVVTGHLKLDNPRQQMEELAVVYGLNVYQQDATISLVNEQQQSRLPVEVMSYQLKYLRGASLNRSAGGSSSSGASGAKPSGAASGGSAAGAGLADFEKLKSIIKPMLTREVGMIEFEEKTNTLLVTDNKVKLERVSKLLLEIDKPKPQIMINVRVLRVKRGQGRLTGVDWSSALGTAGISISATQSLNALFNLPNSSSLSVSGPTDGPTSTIKKEYTPGSGLIFDSAKAQVILRALESSNLVSQEACPTIITEDNEQGIISIVDRFPILVATVTNSAGVQNISEQVRYKIDESDADAAQSPEKSREIGVTLSVTPTLLPDGTVRMKLRPRVAKIIEFVTGKSSVGSVGNSYPRVSESTVEAISRIPSGQSLFLGGFYDYNNTGDRNKVPILGDLPFIKKLFGNNSKQMEQLSLVFVITPSVYDASDIGDIQSINADVGEYSQMPSDDGAANPQLLPEASWLKAERATPFQREQVNSTVTETKSAEPGWIGRLFSRKPKMTKASVAEPSKTYPAFSQENRSKR
jgi:type II secretory pathway component GspD/PulD (secretin)